MSCDVVLIGVGGQGILTIGEILIEAALDAGLSASFLPTKGMAQRGGYVVAELRLGVGEGGPRVRAGGADLVVAMERSEALKGVGYVKAGGSFLLYDHVWEPTGVLLGKDRYPSLDDVAARIESSGAVLRILRADRLPTHQDRPVAANVFTLGAAMSTPKLAAIVDANRVERAVAVRWPRAEQANRLAFRSGLSYSAGAKDADEVG